MQGVLRAWAVTLMLIIALSFTACAGGGAEVKTQSTSTTLGQELKDLEDTHKQGIITEKQYEELKKNLIEQRTK